LSEDQLPLARKDDEQSEAASAAQADAKLPTERVATTRKQHANRRALPPHHIAPYWDLRAD
jgi:hypothetical protein